MKFRENPDNLFDTEARLKALERGVASHNVKMDDEERLAVPSYDESVVSDWIRNRTEAGEDTTDPRGREVFKVETITQPEGDYEKDLEKLKSLTRDELDKLLTEAERKSKEEGGSIFSKGSLLHGYAIDPNTLQSLETTVHVGVGTDLALDIFNSMDVENMGADTASHITRRIIDGLVFLNVPGFKTPILKLHPFGLEELGDKVPKEDIRKIVEHIKKERKLLPISSGFRVL